MFFFFPHYVLKYTRTCSEFQKYYDDTWNLIKSKNDCKWYVATLQLNGYCQFSPTLGYLNYSAYLWMKDPFSWLSHLKWTLFQDLLLLFCSFHTRQTFLTLSLQDMASRVQLSGPQEAEKYVLHMVSWSLSDHKTDDVAHGAQNTL